MNRRSILGFLSLLPFVPLLGRKAKTVEPDVPLPPFIPQVVMQRHPLPDWQADMQADIDYFLHKAEHCEAVGDLHGAEVNRRKLLLLQDAALIYRLDRSRNEMEYMHHEFRDGGLTFYFTLPSNATQKDVFEYSNTLKKRSHYWFKHA